MDRATQLVETLAVTLAQAGDLLLELRALVGGSTREPAPKPVATGLRARGLRGLQAIVEAWSQLPAAVVVAEPTKRARPASRLFEFNGQQLTRRELATLAGCSRGAMEQRLRSGLSINEAVAAGSHMPRPKKPVVEPSPKQPRPRQTFDLDGQALTCKQLAARAGCNRSTMQQRLRRMTPAAAVAFVDGRKTRYKPFLPKADPGVAAPAPPTRAPSVFEVATAKPALRVPESRRRRVDPPKLDPTAEVITPPGLVPIVAQRPKDRYEVDEAPSTFGRIGQYESSGSAIERALRGRV